jgi:hypothetical protein
LERRFVLNLKDGAQFDSDSAAMTQETRRQKVAPDSEPRPPCGWPRVPLIVLRLAEGMRPRESLPDGP